MKLFPRSKVFVTPHFKVWVSNHYRPSVFGIRGKYETTYKSGQYVEMCSPGTGFFVRSGATGAYKSFCAKERAKLKKSYWDMVQGREFDFDTEMARVAEQQSLSKDPITDKILESYANVLPLAKEAELNERKMDGMKRLSKRRGKLSSYQSHILSNIKSNIATSEHKVRGIQLTVPQWLGEERYKEFAPVVMEFAQMAHSHRIWFSRESYGDTGKAMQQVFFDLGIFNYIQAPLMTPLMRDGQGNMLFWYPDFVIVARDAVDFDVYDIKDVDATYREVPYDMISAQVLESYASDDEDHHSHHRNYDDYGEGLLTSVDTMSTGESSSDHHRRSRVVGELYVEFPRDLHFRFYLHDSSRTKHFVSALKKYQDSL